MKSFIFFDNKIVYLETYLKEINKLQFLLRFFFNANILVLL